MDTKTITTFLQTQEVAFATMLKEISSPNPAELQSALASHVESMKSVLLTTIPPGSSTPKSRPMFGTPIKSAAPNNSAKSPTPRRTHSGPASGMFSRVSPIVRKKEKEKVVVADDSDSEEAVEGEYSEDEMLVKGKKRMRSGDFGSGPSGMSSL